MKSLQTCVVGVAIGLVGCATGEISPPGTLGEVGGSSSVQNTSLGGSNTHSAGGSTAHPTGGTVATSDSGNSAPTGGTKAQASGGTSSGNTTGGTKAAGGTTSSSSSNTGATTGGTRAVGGTSSGNTGNTATGGVATSSSKAVGGGAPTGGVAATGGNKAVGGGGPTGGVAATGGNRAAGGAVAVGGGSSSTSTSTSTSTSPSTLDCSTIPAMPTGGTLHSGNGQGGKDNLAWQIWSNGGSGSLTTFNTTAFTAAWNNSGDYLGRMGFEWGSAGKAFTAYGEITAQYAFKKNGTAGQYSYVGLYGWSTNPCIEWYIVEDSFSAMPFNTGTAPSGTAVIDGGTYNLVKRNTTGTGGNRCGNVTAWDQFYSIRTKGSQCGTISVSEHFRAWDAKGWKLGNLLEVKILVEAASGQGSVDFPIANLTKTL